MFDQRAAIWRLRCASRMLAAITPVLQPVRQPVRQQLAQDPMARLTRTFGGDACLRGEIAIQRISPGRLTPELADVQAISLNTR